MAKRGYISKIAELSESEGIFTTAQAQRMGIPRDALHDAVESGRIERILRGAYRLVGSGSSYIDELAAIWKLTAPARFTHERMRVSEWDGVAIGGHTASSLIDIGDLHLSPYRIYTPKRFNTRNPSASFAVRNVLRDEVKFIHGLPVTRAERTIVDMILDDEDPSLVADALRDAVYRDRGFSLEILSKYLGQMYPPDDASRVYEGLLEDAGLHDAKGL